jgi:acetyl-CoA synthetase
VADTPWWQTETGAIMITLPGIVTTKPGSATRAFPGISADVVDERDGTPLGEGQGLLVIKRPWPSMLRTLYREDDRFVETYFSRFGKETYLVGDAARKDEDGYFWIVGRIDDVVNVSGHRMSTAEVESAIVAHPKVAEAAVIGQAVATLVADVLPGNRAMIAVFERSGYPVEVRWRAHGVEVEIDVTPRVPALARAA